MKRDYDQPPSDRLREKARAILTRKGAADDRLPDRIDNILEELRLQQIELELQREELQATRSELVNLKREYDDSRQLGQVRVSSLPGVVDNQAIAELQTSEQRYYAVSREGKIGVWEVTLDNGYLNVDDAVKEILGYTPDELGSKRENWFEVFHPDERAAISEAIEAARAGRMTCYDARHRLFHKDGSIRWFHASGSVGVETGGQPDKVIGTYQDITDLLETEKALARTRFSMDQVQEGQFWIRSDGSFVDCNASACRTLGYSREELLSMSVSDIDPRVGRDFYPQHFEEMKQRRTITLESVHRTRDGLEIPVEIYATYLEHEGEEFICSLVRDISKRQQMRETLTASEEKYRALVERAKDGVALVSGGLLKFVNPALADMLGHTVEEMLGESFEKFIAPDHLETVKKNYRARMAGENVPPTYESALIRKDGSLVDVEYNVGVITYEGGPADMTFVRDITERRKAEEQHRLLSSVVRQTGDGISLVNLDGTVRFVNKVYAEAHGYEPDELVGKHLSIFHTPEQLEAVERSKDILFKTGSFYGELRHVRRDGTTFPTMMHNSLLRDESGKPLGVIAIMRDITDRKTVEALQRVQSDLAFSLGSARDLKTALDLILEAVLKLDGIEAGSIYEVDPDRRAVTMIAHVGLSDEFIAAASRLEIPHNAHGDRVLSGFATYGRQGEVCPDLTDAERQEGIRAMGITPVRYDDQTEAVMWLGSRSSEEIPLGIRRVLESVAAHIGATIARVKAETAYRESERRYDELFNSMLEGIVVADADGAIAFCNPAMAKILEEDSIETVIGKHVTDYVPEGLAEDVVTKAERRKRGESLQYQQEIVTAQGNRRHLHVAVSPRRDDAGRYVGSFGAVMDITETKRLQDLAERARRLETAGQVAGQVAHDFNNLLGPLLAYPELIRAELGSNHSALRFLQDIETAAVQMADINQQLLTLGRRGHYNQKPLNLNALLKEVLARADVVPEGVTLEVRLEDHLMNIKGGAAQLNRVLSNLIANAVDAMEGSGRLTIASQNYYVDTQRRSYERVPRGEFVKITISDTGIGMSEDVKSKIFDPFFTTKPSDKKRGSGLGLSVVHAVIKDHRGHIDVSSRPGEGTSFYLYFPITREEIEAVVPPEVVGGNESILIVDDDSLQREVSSALLSKLGYRVRTAESGEAAIRQLEKESFDLLVLDMIMPPGMDGADTFAQIRRVAPGQKAIIVSGFAQSERVKQARRLGAGEFVKKPLSLEAIARAVRAELDRALD